MHHGLRGMDAPAYIENANIVLVEFDNHYTQLEALVSYCTVRLRGVTSESNNEIKIEALSVDKFKF